jgi:hypothetical protein
MPDAPRALDAGVAKLGKHDAVCILGARSAEPGKKVLECGPGLQCCYACGIPGCDYVCHTSDECKQDMMRP